METERERAVISAYRLLAERFDECWRDGQWDGCLLLAHAEHHLDLTERGIMLVTERRKNGSKETLTTEAGEQTSNGRAIDRSG